MNLTDISSSLETLGLEIFDCIAPYTLPDDDLIKRLVFLNLFNYIMV